MATKDMLGTAVRKLVTLPAATLGPVCDLLEKMADPEWVEATKRFLRKENPWPAIAQAVLGGIDALIQQSGLTKFDDWISNKNAPAYTQPDSEAEVEYLDLGYQESSESAEEEINRRGYRPAEDPEVIRHDMRCPGQLVEGNPVVVLGSVWLDRNGDRNVLILRRVGAGRSVNLYWWRNDWRSSCRFAAVKLSA